MHLHLFVLIREICSELILINRVHQFIPVRMASAGRAWQNVFVFIPVRRARMNPFGQASARRACIGGKNKLVGKGQAAADTSIQIQPNT